MIRLVAMLIAASLAVACGSEPPPAQKSQGAPATTRAAPKAQEPLPDRVRLVIETEAGAITVELDARRAPLTAANFVRYAEEGRLDGTSFYRSAPTPGAENRGFIQGGIRRDYRRMLPPIEHEPTSRTGLRHVEGAISMARSEQGGAMGDFFITTAAMPAMDAEGDEAGYAVFGRVVEGMEVVRRILAMRRVPDAGRGAMRGQMLADPVGIRRVRRVN